MEVNFDKFSITTENLGKENYDAYENHNQETYENVTQAESTSGGHPSVQRDGTHVSLYANTSRGERTSSPVYSNQPAANIAPSDVEYDYCSTDEVRRTDSDPNNSGLVDNILYQPFDSS